MRPAPKHHAKRPASFALVCVAVGAALLTSAAPASAQACKSPRKDIFGLRAEHVGCASARSVARAYGGQNRPGWRCYTRQAPSEPNFGVNKISCRNGSAHVTFRHRFQGDS